MCNLTKIYAIYFFNQHTILLTLYLGYVLYRYAADLAHAAMIDVELHPVRIRQSQAVRVLLPAVDRLNCEA